MGKLEVGGGEKENRSISSSRLLLILLLLRPVEAPDSSIHVQVRGSRYVYVRDGVIRRNYNKASEEEDSTGLISLGPEAGRVHSFSSVCVKIRWPRTDSWVDAVSRGEGEVMHKVFEVMLHAYISIHGCTYILTY